MSLYYRKYGSKEERGAFIGVVWQVSNPLVDIIIDIHVFHHPLSHWRLQKFTILPIRSNYFSLGFFSEFPVFLRLLIITMHGGGVCYNIMQLRQQIPDSYESIVPLWYNTVLFGKSGICSGFLYMELPIPDFYVCSFTVNAS